MLLSIEKGYFSKPISLLFEISAVVLPVILFYNFPYLLPFRTLYIALSFVYIYIFFNTTKISILQSLGITKKNLKLTLLTSISLSSLSIGLLLLILIMYPAIKDLSLILDDLNKVPLAVFLVLYVLISIPLQEFIFRGFFISRLSLISNNKFFLILYPSVLFALAHLSFGQIIILPFAFIFGILLSLLFLKFKNIWGPIIYHAITGVAAMLLLI